MSAQMSLMTVCPGTHVKPEPYRLLEVAYRTLDHVVITGMRGSGKSGLVDTLCASRGITPLKLDRRDLFSDEPPVCKQIDHIRIQLIHDMGYEQMAGSRYEMNRYLAGAMLKHFRGHAHRGIVYLDELDQERQSNVPAIEAWCSEINRLIRSFGGMPPLWIMIVGHAWDLPENKFCMYTIQLNSDTFESDTFGGVRELVERVAEATGISFTDDAVDAIMWQSGGYPLFVEAILLSCQQKHANGQVDARAVRDLLKEFPENEWMRVRHAFFQTGSVTTRLLWSIAQFQIDMEKGWWCGGGIKPYMAQLWPEYTKSFDHILARLINRGLLTGPVEHPTFRIHALFAFVRSLTRDDIESAEPPMSPSEEALLLQVLLAEAAGDAHGAIDMLEAYIGA